MQFDTFDRTGNAEFPFAKQVVFRALCASVEQQSGMSIVTRDDLASRLDIKTGMSAFSWGEKVGVSVMGSGPNSAVISVQSATKTILGSATSHGKNRENVKKIIAATSNLLSAHGDMWETEMGLSKAVIEPTSVAYSVADELKKLAALRADGILTEDEFSAQKASLLQN